MSDPYRVLMLCTGNICRSPTAEVVLRAKLEARGLGERVTVDSAGTSDWHVGQAPTELACRLAAARGYDLQDLRSRQVLTSDLYEVDLVLGMDRRNLASLAHIGSEVASARVSLFLAPLIEENGDGPEEVPDPYGLAESDYAYSLTLIERGADAWVERLEAWLAP